MLTAMSFWGFKKHREFNIEERLHPEKNKKRIEFGRLLPRRKVKPLWWTIAVFIIVLYLYFYLRHYL